LRGKNGDEMRRSERNDMEADVRIKEMG